MSNPFSDSLEAGLIPLKKFKVTWRRKIVRDDEFVVEAANAGDAIKIAGFLSSSEAVRFSMEDNSTVTNVEEI